MKYKVFKKILFLFFCLIHARVESRIPPQVPLGFSAIGASALLVHTLANYRSYKMLSTFKRKKVKMNQSKIKDDSLLAVLASGNQPNQEQDQSALIQNEQQEVVSENKKVTSFFDYLSKDRKYVNSAKCYGALIVGGVTLAVPLLYRADEIDAALKERERLKKERATEKWNYNQMQEILRREKEDHGRTRLEADDMLKEKAEVLQERDEAIRQQRRAEQGEQRLQRELNELRARPYVAPYQLDWLRQERDAANIRVQVLEVQLAAARGNPGTLEQLRLLHQQEIERRDAAIQRATVAEQAKNLADQRIKELETDLVRARGGSVVNPVASFVVGANWIKLLSPEESDPVTLEDFEDNNQIVLYTCKHYCLATSYDNRPRGHLPWGEYQWDGTCMQCRCSRAGIKYGRLRIDPNDKKNQYFVPN